MGGAIEAARRWGAPWLEAYPPKHDLDTGGLGWAAASYKGPQSMHIAAGFTVVRDLGTWLVMRHDLTQD